MGRRILRIFLDGLLEILDALLHAIHRALVPIVAALQVSLMRFGIHRRPRRGRGGGELELGRPSDAAWGPPPDVPANSGGAPIAPRPDAGVGPGGGERRAVRHTPAGRAGP